MITGNTEGDFGMLRSTWMSIISAGLLVGFTTGCSTMSNSVVRSQSPEARLLIHEEQVAQGAPTSTEGEITQVRGRWRKSQISHHGYETSRTASPNGVNNGGVQGQPVGESPFRRWGAHDTQPCPQGAQGGNCYPGAQAGNYAGGYAGNVPPNHQEQAWDHGGRRHRGQYNYHTYSYKTPKDLCYPQQNQPGGAVTYPYYTHKGPSDFFWKGD